MFDFSKLKGRIREICGSDSSFAEAIGLNRSTVSSRLNNKSDWNSDEIKKAADILGIAVEQIGEYFFTEKVASKQH